MKDEVKIPPKEIKGLKVWCPVCKTEVRQCLKNGKGLDKCESKPRLCYRIVLYYKGSKQRKVVHLETKNLEEAITEKLRIEKQMVAGETAFKKPRVAIEEIKETGNDLKLVDGMSYYISFIRGERGFEHERCHPRSPKHCADVEKTFTLFGKSLVKNSMDVEVMTVNAIGGREVGFFHTYLLEDMKYGSHSYNRNITNLSSLINYLNSHENQKLENHFSKVIRKHTESKVTIIEPKDFQALLEAVNHGDSYKLMKDGKKRIFYYDFLPTAFKLALLCGIRREPLANLRYSDVRENENKEPVVILSKNMKVNKIQASKTGIEKTIPTPVTPQLKRLLYNELDYRANRGSNKFLIGNNSGLSRDFIVSVLSKSFAHFWKQTGIKKDAEFSDLRKTFINKMQLALGDNARHVTGHASSIVMDTFYLNKSFFSEAVRREDIFPELEVGNNKKQRKEELNETRNKKSHKQIVKER
jgi:integrase